MSAELVRYPIEHGGALVVEVPADSVGYQRAGRAADGVIDAGTTLQEAIKSLVPATNALVDELSQLNASAITVEFGIKLSGEANAIVAKVTAEGNFTISLTFASKSDQPNQR